MRTIRDLNPSKVARVAVREYVSTALTKGFIIGAFVVPALLIPVIGVIVLLVGQAKPPAERGVVAVIDPTYRVAEPFVERIDPAAIAQRRGESARAAAEAVEGITGGLDQGRASGAIEQAVIADVPNLTVEVLDAGDEIDALIESQQARLREPAGREDPRRLVALAVIDEDAVLGPAGGEPEGGGSPGGPTEFGAYELFVRPKLDARTTAEIRESLAWAIRRERFEAAGADQSLYRRLSHVDAPGTREVTETGTREAAIGLNELLPFAVMFLVFMGVMTGGQYLLTTTVEEKSSRVVEVLLSAVSPIELMLGKILGQLGVGLTILVAYNAVGLIALLSLGLLDVISPATILSMLVFFLLAYFMFAALMGAVGAAVNELREAQSLLTPVMLILIAAFYLSFPVSRDPDALYAQFLSFIPPFSPFVMLTRVTSNEPPPVWQVLAAIGINTLAAAATVWLAAKIFRVGLLMFGKAPSFGTLIKWVRMA